MSMNGRQNNMYNDFLSVNHSFQNSVNLQLDLGNERKIDEYIITGDICNVLKKYFLTFLGHNKILKKDFFGIFFILLNMWKGNLFLAKFFGKIFFIFIIEGGGY